MKVPTMALSMVRRNNPAFGINRQCPLTIQTMEESPYDEDRNNWEKYLVPFSGDYISQSPSHSEDLVQTISGQQLKFNHLTLETIIQLLSERQEIRDKNHKGIMGQITDVSGDISCWENLKYSQDARKHETRLARLKADLERELRDQDITLWRDTFELRQALIDAEKRYESAKLRAGLVFPSSHDESKPISNAAYSGYVPGP